MEQMYRDAHAKIRASPAQEKKKPREGLVKKRSAILCCTCGKLLKNLQTEFVVLYITLSRFVERCYPPLATLCN